MKGSPSSKELQNKIIIELNVFLYVYQYVTSITLMFAFLFFGFVYFIKQIRPIGSNKKIKFLFSIYEIKPFFLIEHILCHT